MDDWILRHTEQLRADGWSKRDLDNALKAGTLARVVRGVIRTGGEVAQEAAHLVRARAVLMRQSTSVLSHESAALVHRLPIRLVDPPLVHLTAAPPAHARVRSGYHVHVAPLEADDLVTVNGLRVTSVARTVADVARSAPYAWGAAMADRGLARGITREELLARAESVGKRTGAGRVRQVIAFADARAESPAESASRVTMARAGLPAPTLQFEVRDATGWLATCDFAWEEHRVVGEVDGKAKFGRLLKAGDTPEDAAHRQVMRDEALRQAGWWPCHWSWEEAWDVRKLTTKLEGAFRAAENLPR